MTITVKRWMADKKAEEMAAYNLMPVYKYFDDPMIGKYYIDKDNDTVTFKAVEKIRESEKAMQVAIECETIGFRAHDPYRTWFPKSAIVSIQ